MKLPKLASNPAERGMIAHEIAQEIRLCNSNIERVSIIRKMFPELILSDAVDLMLILNATYTIGNLDGISLGK
jgi:hypothetical protein